MRFNFSVFAATIVLTMLVIRPANAQLSFVLNNPTQSVMVGGSPLTFTMDFSNGAQAATLDGFSAIFVTPNAPTPDTTPFGTYVSGLADPIPANFSDTAITFFTVDPASISPGIYTGTATISYDTDGITVHDVTQNFTVTITPSGASAAPEPASFALLFPVLLGGLAVIRRRN